LVSKHFEDAALVPRLGEPLKTILQCGGKGTISAMRVRDESGVPFRWILEYWRIYHGKGAIARQVRF
jgi:hypothetical protein